MPLKAIDLDLGEHEEGYQWVAGSTPEDDPAPGRWIVRRNADSWMVLFRSITRAQYSIQDYPGTLEGERAAKMMALKLVDIANGRIN
jgi:hypothetical protein